MPGQSEAWPNTAFDTDGDSIVDYVFRALAVEYLNRNDLAQVTPRSATCAETRSAAASGLLGAASPPMTLPNA
jgi:hypothetical protein